MSMLKDGSKFHAENVILANNDTAVLNKVLEILVTEVHLIDYKIWEDTQYILLRDLDNNIEYLPKLLVTNMHKDKCFMLIYEENWCIKLYDISICKGFTLTGKLHQEFKEASNDLKDKLLDLNFTPSTVNDLLQILSKLNII